MTKISNLPQDTNPTGTDFVPTYETTSGQTHKVLLSDIGEYIGSYPQNPYKFYAYRSSAFTGGTPAKIALNAEVFDSNNNFDSTTNNRYTVPVTGYYQFNGNIVFTGGSGSGFAAYLYKNGSIVLQGNASIYYAGPFTGGSSVSGLLYLVAGDYIELWWYGSGMAGSTGAQNTYLMGHLVSVT